MSDPTIFMQTQAEVLQKVIDSGTLEKSDLSELIFNHALGGQVLRDRIELWIAEGLTTDQMAVKEIEFLKSLSPKSNVDGRALRPTAGRVCFATLGRWGLYRVLTKTALFEGITFTDRYDALGIPTPDPETMCHGECEGTGVYPVYMFKGDKHRGEEGHCSMIDEEANPVDIASWEAMESEKPCDDGYHFVKCRDCGGTGKSIQKAASNAEHSYSCLMVGLPSELRGEILKWSYANVPEEILYIEEEGLGRELDTHATVKYGLITEDAGQVFGTTSQKPIKFKLGKTFLFDTNPKYDVLVMHIESPDLEKENAAISKLENEDSHPEYIPHCTIAYLKKGSGAELVDKQVVDPKMEHKFYSMIFSNKSNEKIEKPLKASVRTKEAKLQPERYMSDPEGQKDQVPGKTYLWLDDTRTMPADFNFHAKTAAEAISQIDSGSVVYISLDHDLGAEAGQRELTGYDVAKHIEEGAANGTIPPMTWAVHSANPAGAERIQAAMTQADKFWAGPLRFDPEDETLNRRFEEASSGQFNEEGLDKTGAAIAEVATATVVIDKPIRIDELQISFHEMFFDYYLRAPGQPDGYYVTDVAEQKVGFGSKYQLKKFMDELLLERFTDGIIHPGVIRVQPIPEISAPVVRRLGNKATPVVDHALSEADHRKRLRGDMPVPIDEIAAGQPDTLQTIMVKPTQSF